MSDSPSEPSEIRFLTVEQVVQLHADGIRLYGGDPGIRDYGLVESATLAPQQTWGGEFLCKDIAEMAATYWYNLTSNHGFVDGNKRVGLAACDVFLLMNQLDLSLSDTGEAIEVALKVASSEMTKEELTELLRAQIRDF
jgi:death-on-curing protein